MKTRFLLLFVTLSSVLCHAGGSSCTNATLLVPDGRVLNLDVVQPSGTVYYTFTATAGRSYSIDVHDDLDADNADLTVNYYQTSACTTAMAPASGPPYTSTTFRDTSNLEPFVGAATSKKRISIPAPAPGAYFIKVVNSGTSAHYLSVSV